MQIKNTFNEEDYIQLSGIQHFVFCQRQWALIHIEAQWSDNLRTTEGMLMHDRAHNEALREKRGNVIITRGMSICSRRMGVSGKCDVLEFHADNAGVPLAGENGLWLPFPVEYKRGSPKNDDCDRAQLCAQAMCLEEMLCCNISQGALFYGETHRRLDVDFDDDLRSIVEDCVKRIHELVKKDHTPVVKPTKACSSCSLKDICLPKLTRSPSVVKYMMKALEE